MTTIELRTSIVADLDQMSAEMLESVSLYVKRLRRRSMPVQHASDKMPDVVLRLIGAGVPVADSDLDGREAYVHYLEEKYR